MVFLLILITHNLVEKSDTIAHSFLLETLLLWLLDAAYHNFLPTFLISNFSSWYLKDKIKA